jgi:hypothetical protein
MTRSAVTLGAAVVTLAAIVSCVPANEAGEETFADAATGIRVRLPPHWHDRYSVQALDGAMDPTANRARRVVYFKYLPRDTKARAEILFALYLYRRADWDSVAAEPGPPQGDLVAEKDSLALIASLPQSNPFAPGSADAAAFDSLALTAAQVRRAVSLE